MRVGVKAASSGSPNVPSEVHIVMLSNNICEVRDSGIQVFD